MQPFKYITEVASTNTFSPSMSKVLSIIPAAFSNCMEYENPEQPPPTTPMRRPAGTGFCCPMISFTLETALAVSETGGVFLTSGALVFTSGTVVVAIRISLRRKCLNYSRGRKLGARIIGVQALKLYKPCNISMPPAGQRFFQQPLANGSIMVALGPPSGFQPTGLEARIVGFGGVADRVAN